MANNYFQQLARGLQSGSQAMDPTKLTQDQIALQQQGNPLFGYGFKSAQQQQQEQLQAQQQDYLMQQYQEQMLMERAAADPNASIRMNAAASGLGLGRAIGARMNPKPPTPTPKDDPMMQRYAQLASEMGEGPALVFLGNELLAENNPVGAEMVKAGQAAIAAQKKGQVEQATAEVELDAKKRELHNAGLPYKIGQRQTVSRDINGRPMLIEQEFGGMKDGRGIWYDVEKGTKASVTDTNEGFGLTRAQSGEQNINAQASIEGANNLFDVTDRLDALYTENPDAMTWAGNVSVELGSALAGLSAAGRALTGSSTGQKIVKMADGSTHVATVKDYEGFLEGLQISNVQQKALVFELAYAKIAMNQGANARPTDADFKQAMEEVAGNVGNVNARKALIAQMRERAVEQVINKLESAKDSGGKSMASQYQADIDKLKARLRRPIGTVALRDPKTGKKYNIPKKEADGARSRGFVDAE